MGAHVPFWPRACRYCGNGFVAHHVNEQVCSVACRLWRNVDRQHSGECWPWVKAVGPDGYARSKWPDGKLYYPHRLAVQVDGRDIPDGMFVDHICRNRRCCNPSHLRIVSPGVNATENSLSPTAINKARETCVRGHSLSGGNLAIQVKNGMRKRRCRECARIYSHQRQERVKR